MSTSKTVELKNNRIEIRFPWDVQTLAVVKDIPGRDWRKDEKVWIVPATPWHFGQVRQILGPLGFHFDQSIIDGANSTGQAPLPPKHKYPKGLYPFQRLGVDFLYRAGGRGILADEMGLGKTITSLTFVRTFAQKTLVVCPANVVYKWEEEAKKWLLPATRIGVVPNGKTPIGDVDVAVMSYNIMVSHQAEIKDLPFDTAIFDEAHYLKSSRAERTKAARLIVRSGVQNILFLSGTPFLNRPIELYSLLNMLDPAGYSNYYQFAARYCGAEFLMGHWYLPDGKVTHADELVERLKSIMIRRTKNDVKLDLPDLTRTSVPVDLSNMAVYKKAHRDIRTWLKSKKREVQNPEHILTRLNVLRQIAGEGKVNAAVELTENILQDGKQVVLFAHHKDVIKALTAKLKPHGVKVIDGSTPQKERQENVNLFLSKNSSCRVMICSTAGKEGIDLYTASDIVFVEREWTPAYEEQMEGRLHRIGQKNAVTAWYIVGRKSVDEKLDKIVRRKRETVGKVIKQDEIIEEILDELKEEK